jgi:DHA1 family multidrug resistance protein-like MFS transporter
MAGNAFIRSIFGAGFVVFATAMYENLGIAWASSLLGFLGCAFLPIPFLLFYVSDKFCPCPWHY